MSCPCFFPSVSIHKSRPFAVLLTYLSNRSLRFSHPTSPLHPPHAQHAPHRTSYSTTYLFSPHRYFARYTLPSIRGLLLSGIVCIILVAVAGLSPGYHTFPVSCLLLCGIRCCLYIRRRLRQSSLASKRILESNADPLSRARQQSSPLARIRPSKLKGVEQGKKERKKSIAQRLHLTEIRSRQEATES